MVNINPRDKISLHKEDNSIELNGQNHQISLQNIKKHFKVGCKTYLPILGWIPQYTLHNLQCDFIAGVTVGLMVVPQALAYASIARLSNEYGLFSSFVGSLVYTFLGTSKDVTIGPTAILSLMVASYNVPHCAETAVALSLYVGMILLTMGIFRLGFLVRFVSIPVISAFTSAAAITIACGQLKDWNGLAHVPRDFFGNLSYIFKHFSEWNFYDLAYGLICVVVLSFMRLLPRLNRIQADTPRYSRILRKFAWFCGIGKNAIVVLFSCFLMYAFAKYGIIHDFTLISNLAPGLPTVKPPKYPLHCEVNTSNVDSLLQSVHHITDEEISFSRSLEIFSSGLGVIPILAFMEAMAIGKAFGRINNYKILPTQELIALGMANIIGCFFSAYPVTGSFSRTAVNSQSGVKTPLSGIFTATVVILATQYLTEYFRYIPKACLGSVIICAVINMVDLKIIKSIWKVNKIDLIPYTITFLGCFYTLETGLFMGIACSLLFLLYSAVSPKLHVEHRDVTVIIVEEGILYVGVERIVNKVDELLNLEDPPAAIVLDMKGVCGIDYTVAAELYELVTQMKKSVSETSFWIINARFSVKRILLMSNLQDVLTTWENIIELYGSVRSGSVRSDR